MRALIKFTTYTAALASAIIILALNLSINAPSAQTQQLQPACHITPLTNNDYDDEFPVIDNGQVAWRGWDGTDNEIYFWNGVTTIQLTNDTVGVSEPDIDAGQIVWTASDAKGDDGEVFFWNGVTTIQITDNTSGEIDPQISKGQITWFTPEYDVYFWDGDGIRLMGSAEWEIPFPRIDNGRVAWMNWDGTQFDIYLWNGTSTIIISTTQSPDGKLFEGLVDVDNGQVVWHLTDDDTIAAIMFWDGSTTRAITDSNAIPRNIGASWPRIDQGWITWNSFTEVYLWDGVTIRQLSNGSSNNYLPNIDNHQVVWQGNDGNDKEIYFWDGDTTRQLTNNAFDDERPEIDGSHIVWHGFDGSDKEIFLANCNAEDKPLNLTVSGDLTTAPVAPTLSWTYPFAGPQTPNYRVVMQRDGNTTLDETFAGASTCTGTACSVNLAGVLKPWGLAAGSYQWWVGALGANGHAAWSDAGAFTVSLPPAAIPDPTTVDTTGGQITVSFPNDPNTFWVQLVIAGNPDNRYNQWHERDGSGNAFTCDETTCTIVPNWTTIGSNSKGELYQLKAWMQAWGPGGTSSAWGHSAPFTLPGAPVPDPITVDPADGRIAVYFPNDPRTQWGQLWLGPIPQKSYNKWHQRDGSGNAFTCNETTCVIYPQWDVPAKDAQGNPYEFRAWMRAWSPRGMSNGWNGSAPFTLPQQPPSVPTDIDILIKMEREIADFTWTGQPGSTWYQILLRESDATTVVHSSWHLGIDIGCPGALAEPADYACAVADLNLDQALKMGTSYDIFVRAWGPGGMSIGGIFPGMESYGHITRILPVVVYVD